MNENWNYVKSSNLQAIKLEKNILSIMFLDGSIYEYYGVNEIIFDNFLKSYSKGKFFHINIKKFQCRKIK